MAMDNTVWPQANSEEPTPSRLPAIYLGHGAPPLLEDEAWMAELGAWADSMPRPEQILIVSAHWETAPMAISATTPVPLVYDFYGFPEHYYRMTYDAPGAPGAGGQGARLMPAPSRSSSGPTRGLDHGAWVPLKAMYPDADIPVLQISMPDLDPEHLFEVGRRLAPLRDEGVLIIGSGFMTHGLPFIHEYFLGQARGAAVVDRLRPVGDARRSTAGDVDTLFDFREKAPGMPYRASDGGALRAALRHPGCGGEARRAPDYAHRGVRLRPLEALVRGALSGPPTGR